MNYSLNLELLITLITVITLNIIINKIIKPKMKKLYKKLNYYLDLKILNESPVIICPVTNKEIPTVLLKNNKRVLAPVLGSFIDEAITNYESKYEEELLDIQIEQTIKLSEELLTRKKNLNK